jgi:hypothetical protein
MKRAVRHGAKKPGSMHKSCKSCWSGRQLMRAATNQLHDVINSTMAKYAVGW